LILIDKLFSKQTNSSSAEIDKNIDKPIGAIEHENVGLLSETCEIHQYLDDKI